MAVTIPSLMHVVPRVPIWLLVTCRGFKQRCKFALHRAVVGARDATRNP